MMKNSVINILTCRYAYKLASLPVRGTCAAAPSAATGCPTLEVEVGAEAESAAVPSELVKDFRRRFERRSLNAQTFHHTKQSTMQISVILRCNEVALQPPSHRPAHLKFELRS
jgi:hypothetical protein